MSQALFTVIGGTLVNLAKVTHIEESTVQPGHVIVFLENKEKVVCNGTMETVLLKISGGDSQKRTPAPPPPTHSTNGRG